MLNKEQIKIALCDLYGFSFNDLIVENANMGTGNNFFVSHLGQKFFCKTFDCFNVYDNLENEILSIRKLKESGLPIADYLCNNFGKELSLVGDETIVLQSWCEGTPVEKYQVSQEYLFDSIKYLAKINIALRDFDFTSRFLDINDNVQKSIDNCKELLKLTDDKKIIDCLNYKIKALKTFIDDKLDMQKFTYCNSHGDYSIIQTISKDDKLAYIVDFSRACKLPIIWEIIRSYSYASPECKNGKFNESSFKKYLNEYKKHNDILSDYDIENGYALYALQLLQSNFGFSDYIKKGNSENLNFAFWRVEMSKTLLNLMNEMKSRKIKGNI